MRSYVMTADSSKRQQTTAKSACVLHSHHRRFILPFITANSRTAYFFQTTFLQVTKFKVYNSLNPQV